MVKNFCDILEGIEARDPEPPQVYQPPANPNSTTMRPSLEVLQRMANGIDPFDHNRFKAAVAALQFETPKLSMNTSQNLNVTGVFGIAARLERARLRVINGGADMESADPPTEPTPDPT